MNSTLADQTSFVLSAASELTSLSSNGKVLQYGLAAFATTLLSLIAVVSYQPKVHEKSPAFTHDTTPILGSLGFMTRQW
jgi:hypothetical protein